VGKFTYQSGPRIDIEDRTLAHLQVVIANKLRRNESFIFSWREDVRAGVAARGYGWTRRSR